jgi:hypothetical protein
MDLFIACCGAIALMALIAWIHVSNRRRERELTPEQRKDLNTKVENSLQEW